MSNLKVIATAVLILSLSLFASGCGHGQKKIAKMEQAEAARDVGEAYMAEGNYTRALRELLRAEQLNPEDPYLHNDLGLTYLAKGEPKKAVDHFKTALELRPEYSPARNNLGTAYIALEEWDKAVACFEDVKDDLLYATPHYPLTNLGYVYFRKGEYHLAEKYYLEALDLKYDFPKALHGLGQVYIAMCDYEKAIKRLERAVEKAPKAAPIYMDLGRAYAKNFQYNKALNAYRKAAAIAMGTPLADEAEAAAESIRNTW